jgi:hypothetical protein
MESKLNSKTDTFLDISGVLFYKLEVQALLPQPPEASQAMLKKPHEKRKSEIRVKFLAHFYI